MVKVNHSHRSRRDMKAGTLPLYSVMLVDGTIRLLCRLGPMSRSPLLVGTLVPAYGNFLFGAGPVPKRKKARVKPEPYTT